MAATTILKLAPSPTAVSNWRNGNSTSSRRLSFAASNVAGESITSSRKLRLKRRRYGANLKRRSPFIVSPKAVSDSQTSQTCLDPDASSSVLGIILGGGAGTRLYPLTKKRAKPAVPLGANYRLIDIPVSNCLNSNISKIYVLTQFNSASLSRHLSRAYASNMGGMDYERFIQAHRETDADITVAALPMDEKRAIAFGLMKIDEEGRITEFAEKPKGEQLKAMKSILPYWVGLDDKRAKDMPYIASMGIYVVSKDVMLNLLRNEFPAANDFGSDVIPGATSMGLRVQAYLFDGYWEDIGTIEAFYNANLGITKKPVPDFSFYDRSAAIYTQPRYLPPSKILDADVTDSVIGEGCVIKVMDYERFIQAHRETDADITVAALPMDEKRATAFGLMKIDEEGRITEFAEKPKGEQLKAMKVDTTILGLDDKRAKDMPYIASMGIYVISKDVMLNLLRDEFPAANDFGSEVIPGATSMGLRVRVLEAARLLHLCRVQAYLFDGYWGDVGTIEAFYNANLGITKKPVPDFSFYDRSAPIYTQPRYLPPSKMLDADVTDSVIGEGCVIKNCKIHHSVVGLRSCISEGAVIEDSLLMGADYYETDADRTFLAAKGGLPIGIGKNTHIKRAIIDKNARIGENVKIINSDNVQEAARETDGYFIKSGIVTVIKDALIPSGSVI
ncbi:Glucose-1-phosphate adenylyltransferase small subunit, chloroplastic/amyloplastic [Orobanche hederae]